MDRLLVGQDQLLECSLIAPLSVEETDFDQRLNLMFG